MKLTDTQTSNLPAVAPDLLLQKTAGFWQVNEVSDRLAISCDSAPSLMKGRLLDRVFNASSPPLSPLLEEVIQTSHDLTDVKVRLFPGQEPLLADLRFSGFADDYSTPYVQVFLRAETVASQIDTTYAGMVGQSPAMREVFRKIDMYAATDASVVITGETGCGKELVAQALHQQGKRKRGPFAAINCSAISEQLLESELFGHEKGAFTGAIRAHRGHFEQADGGTLFLDEIGDMPLQIQSKLLRVLEDGKIQPVGCESPRQVDVRVVAATNVSLETAVSKGRFRSDLYHRLAVLRIQVPSLRERSEDIPLLAGFFLQEFNRRYDKQIERLTPEAMSILSAYLWPGNIRELRNLLERLVIETQAPAIGGRALAEWVRERQAFQPGGLQLARRETTAMVPFSDKHKQVSVIDAELVTETQTGDLTEEVLREAYSRAGGNISAAARTLGIHRATFYRHLHRFGLNRCDLSD